MLNCFLIIERFLPPGNRGNILITSRNHSLKRVTTGRNSSEIIEMGERDGISLFLKSAMLEDETSEHIGLLARQLISELGGLPLAIDQAGSYIHACRCSINNYLDLFSKYKHKLMSDPEFMGASEYGSSTYGTWEISMQEIETRAQNTDSKALASQSAIVLLKILAFIHLVNVPEQLFKNAAENYVQMDIQEKAQIGLPLSATLLDNQILFLNEEAEWDELQFKAGMQVLIAFSLVKASDDELYSMHPLVHSWNMDQLPRSDVSDQCQRVKALLACSVSWHGDMDEYVFCRLLVPHIKANDQHGSNLKITKAYYYDEKINFACAFECVGNWDESEQLLLEVADQRKAKFGSNHPHTLVIMANLAFTYSEQGKWDDAEELQLDVLKACKTKLGPDHPDTLTIMANLASTYRNQGKWDDAEELQLDVLKAHKTKLGPDHPHTLSIMANLASTYRNQGRWDDAEELQLDVLKACKTKLGPDHPDTLRIMAKLASTYWNQGKWDDAEELQLDVLKADKTKLGPDHPHTLSIMANLASTYWNQGKWDDAEKLQLDVLKAHKTKLGPDHPDILSITANLASTYWNQGKWDDAEKLQLDVLEAHKTKLGPDHPDTLSIMANLASTYRNQGKWDDAEELQLDVLKACKTKFGPDHPDTLTIMANLALTYWEQGKLHEAESLLSLTVKSMHQVMTSSHPTTIQYMQQLETLHKIQSQSNSQGKLNDISKTKQRFGEGMRKMWRKIKD